MNSKEKEKDKIEQMKSAVRTTQNLLSEIKELEEKFRKRQYALRAQNNALRLGEEHRQNTVDKLEDDIDKNTKLVKQLEKKKKGFFNIINPFK